MKCLELPVRRGEWLSISPVHGFYLPSDLPPCVYVFIGDGVPLYVGQTTNLRARLRTHCFRYSYDNKVMTPWNIPDPKTAVLKVKFSERFGDWLMLEARLIRRLQPRCNVAGVRSRRAAA